MPSLAPSLGSLRLAKLSDLPRISVVAAAGFYNSPVFQFERPHFNRYPRDTIANYRCEYQKAILDPEFAVLVAIAKYKKNEVESVYDALSVIYDEILGSEYPGVEDQTYAEEKASAKVIVGIVSLSLKADRARHGEFLPEGPDALVPTQDLQDLRRDKCSEAARSLDEHLTGPEEKWLNKRLEIATMVVHPAYWREAHGSELSRWCMQLASTDNIGLGASAVRMGRDLFYHLGFQEAETVGVSEHGKKILSIWICVLDHDVRHTASWQRNLGRYLLRQSRRIWSQNSCMWRRLISVPVSTSRPCFSLVIRDDRKTRKGKF